MDQNVVFKTAAVGGFEKRAVLDYIYEMNESMEREREEFHNKIAELENARLLAVDEANIANEKLRTLEDELVSLTNELSTERHKRKEIEGINARLESQKNALAAQASELKAETREIASVPVAQREELETLKAKQEEFDKASYQLGRVLLEARADADATVETAKEQAKIILEQAQKDAEEISEMAAKTADDLIKSAEDTARVKIEKAKEEEQEILFKANELSSARITAAEKQSDSVIQTAREHISKIVATSNRVVNESNSQIDRLGKETDSLKLFLDNTFEMLRQKSHDLDNLISVAKNEIEGEHGKITELTLAEISELSLEELREIISISEDKPEGKQIAESVNEEDALKENTLAHDYAWDSPQQADTESKPEEVRPFMDLNPPEMPLNLKNLERGNLVGQESALLDKGEEPEADEIKAEGIAIYSEEE